MWALLLCSQLLCQAVPAGTTQSELRTPKLSLIPIADNVYTVAGVSPLNEHPISGDAHFIVTSAGVVLIDVGSTPAFGRELAQLIKTVTTAPVKLIIYSHWHWDHVLGAAAFAGPGVEIIAQENFLKNIKQHWGHALVQARLGVFGYGADFADFPLVAPTRSYRDTHEFKIGGEEFQLIATRGETDDQTFVYLPRTKLLFVGDHFNPMLGHPLTPEGDIDGFLSGIDTIERIKPERIVHGHGEFTLMTPNLASLQQVKSVTLSIRDQVTARVHAGASLEEAQAAVMLPAEFAGNAFAREAFRFIKEPFVNRLYRDATGYFASDASPVNYSPAPRKRMADIWSRAAGGTDQLLALAQELLQQGEAQAALEVLEVAALASPQNARVRALQADAFTKLAGKIGYSNFYLYFSYTAAAQRLRDGVAESTAGTVR